MTETLTSEDRVPLTKLAAELGVNRKTVARWADEGYQGERLENYRIGRKRFSHEASGPTIYGGDEWGAELTRLSARRSKAPECSAATNTEATCGSGGRSDKSGPPTS